MRQAAKQETPKMAEATVGFDLTSFHSKQSRESVPENDGDDDVSAAIMECF